MSSLTFIIECINCVWLRERGEMKYLKIINLSRIAGTMLLIDRLALAN